MTQSRSAWILGAGLIVLVTTGWTEARGEERNSKDLQTPPADTSPALPALPRAAACDRPLPINLATALQLAGARPIDIQLAAQRVQLAAAELERARALWLPSVYLGIDYFRHDGVIQDTVGNVVPASKWTFMVGAGPYAVFALSDALFGPLAARQVSRARQAELQTARNDSLLSVARAYFDVQQARGELAGALDTVNRTEDLLHRTEVLSKGLIPPVEVVRVRTELTRRRQLVTNLRARWRVASADLARLLRLDPAVLVEPVEPPNLFVTVVPGDRPVDDLITVALTTRPELAGQQALVQATLARLRQERLRPLVPSILLRGGSTVPAGTLAGGYFGGGSNDSTQRFGGRGDFDVQVLWELENLGLGNRARVHERQAENHLALLELFRLQDQVAADTTQAFAEVQAAAERRADAESALRDALELVQKNFEGLSQTRRTDGVVVLVIRPQEAVAAVQALAQAYTDYYTTVGDYDRAQFRLYHALGQPAQSVVAQQTPCPLPHDALDKR